KWTTRQKVIIGTCIFIGAIGILEGALKEDKKTEPSNDAPSRFEICSYSQAAISLVLKSPSTAKYSGCDETRISDLGYGRYEVTGTVDASNAFGAVLRKRWIVKLKFENGKASVEEIPVIEE